MSSKSRKVDIRKIQELLGKLASDDGFREEFTKKPASILAGYGIEVPSDTKANLPPKDVLAETLTSFVGSLILVPWRPWWSPYWGWGWGWGWGPVWGPVWGWGWSVRQPQLGDKGQLGGERGPIGGPGTFTE